MEDLDLRYNKRLTQTAAHWIECHPLIRRHWLGRACNLRNDYEDWMHDDNREWEHEQAIRKLTQELRNEYLAEARTLKSSLSSEILVDALHRVEWHTIARKLFQDAIEEYGPCPTDE